MDVISLTADDLALTAAARSVDVSLTPPRANSLRLPKTAIHVQSYTFAETQAPAPAPPAVASAAQVRSDDAAAPFRNGKSPTRLRPPRDIVKLADRLYYLLQPPLESLLASDQLDFPFSPFSYQYQGVAFLYPRYSAILADEM